MSLEGRLDYLLSGRYYTRGISLSKTPPILPFSPPIGLASSVLKGMYTSRIRCFNSRDDSSPYEWTSILKDLLCFSSHMQPHKRTYHILIRPYSCALALPDIISPRIYLLLGRKSQCSILLKYRPCFEIISMEFYAGVLGIDCVERLHDRNLQLWFSSSLHIDESTTLPPVDVQ